MTCHLTALHVLSVDVVCVQGDVVLFFDSTYASVKKMARKVCQERGAVASEKPLPCLNAQLTPQALADAVAGLCLVLQVFGVAGVWSCTCLVLHFFGLC